LSKDDQNFIRQWIIKQARTLGDNILTFGATPIRGNSEAPLVESTTQIATGWTENYKIKVSNATPVNWSNLQLRYIIFYTVSHPGVMPPANYTAAHAVGSVAIPDLSGSHDQTVDTGKINLKSVTLAPRVVYSNGAPPNVTDVLDGVWVRVYDENNNLLQEWAYPSDISKDKNWDALSPPPRPARRAAKAAN
jgi:hypothetical protein